MHRFASLSHRAFFLAARTPACYKRSRMIFRRLALLLAALFCASSVGRATDRGRCAKNHHPGRLAGAANFAEQRHRGDGSRRLCPRCLECGAAANRPRRRSRPAFQKQGTAAFLSSDQNAFTSRTAGFIIQQHFPPGVFNTPTGPLVGVGLSSLFFSDINKFKGPGSVDDLQSHPGVGRS